jgi:uncharacterized membrane protein
MAHSHHGGTRAIPVPVGRWPRFVLLGTLAIVAVAVAVGLVALWPSSGAVDDLRDNAQFAAPGVTFPDAVVTAVRPPCATVPDPDTGELPPEAPTSEPTCGLVTARVSSGSDTGRQVSFRVAPEVSRSGLRAGDQVKLLRTPADHGQPAGYSYWTIERAPALGWLALAFVVLVLAVARLRGLMAIIGLGVSGLVISQFVLPALLAGEPGTWVALCGSAAILYVVLYSTHGLSMRTSAALAGTLMGIGLTAAIGWYAIGTSRLTGVADESGGILSSLVGTVDFHDLLMCGVIIAGLGVLNDVTITQASAVWELRAAAPEQSRRSVFTGAMRIGRDHIASTIYTIVFAYAGGAIVVLLLLTLYNRPMLDLLSAEEITEEVVRTLASAMGLVAAVPLTTAIAALVASPGLAPEQAPVSQPRTSWPTAPDPADEPDPFDAFWSRK